MGNSNLNISLNKNTIIKRLVIGLILFEALLIFLDIFVSHFGWGPTGGIRRMVNITREDSLGTWFSSTQTILVGLTLFFIGLSAHLQKQSKRSTRGWYVLAGFFTFMGVDDAIKFHERIGSLFKFLYGSQRHISAADATGIDAKSMFDIFPSYSWQVVFGPFFGAMGLFILFFLWKELQKPKLRLLFIAGLSLFVLAVGLDFVEGLNGVHHAIATELNFKPSIVRHMSKALEEFLEMLGTTFFLWAFLDKLMDSPRWEIQFKG